MRQQTAEFGRRLTAVPVIKSGLSLMTGTLLTSALGLVFWVVAAELYDTGDFGVASTTIYTMMALADVAGLGLRTGLLRFLPSSEGSTGRTIIWGYVLATVAAGLVALVFLAGLGWWAEDLQELGDTPGLFLAFLLATACWALFNLQDAVLVALRKAPWVPIENTLFGILKIVLLFPFVTWAPTFGIFWAWTLPVFPIVVAINVLIIGVLRDQRRTRAAAGAVAGAGRASLRRLLSFSLADWLASVARLGSLVVIPLMVLAVVGKVETAYFNTAWLIAFTVFTLSVNAAYALLAENSHERHLEQRNTIHVGLLSLGLTVPIAVVGVLAAPILLLIFPDGFADNAAMVLRILLIAAVPNAVYQVHIGRLRSQDRMRRVVALETMLSVIVVSLSWLFLPRFGIEGVGWAWLVSLSAFSLYALSDEWASWKRSKDPDDPMSGGGGPSGVDPVAPAGLDHGLTGESDLAGRQ